MKLSEFKFDLPSGLISLYPAENRDESRMMVIHRDTGEIEDRIFKDIVEYFDEKDVLVVNDTKVFPARLYGNKEKTGAKIEIDDVGKVNIYSTSAESVEKAMQAIQNIVQEAEVNKIYNGIVKRIMDFGAFVEIFPGTDGLVHISQLTEGRVNNVRDILKEGDEVKVKVIDVDRQGKIKLSRKDALPKSDHH